MITFALISVVSGQVFVDDTFDATPSVGGDITVAYQDCKRSETMLSKCHLMTVRKDGNIIFTDLKTMKQLVVETNGKNS